MRQAPTGRIRRTDAPACTASPSRATQVELNAHVGLAGIDHNQGGVIATAARAVNMIEPVCTAPSGLLAARDLPAAHIRGVMW